MDDETGLQLEGTGGSKKDFDLQMKVIIIGDSCVGKSCLLNYYLRNTCKYPKELMTLLQSTTNRNIRSEWSLAKKLSESTTSW